MKKILLIILAIVILALGAWYLFLRTPSKLGTGLTPPPSLPVATSSTSGGLDGQLGQPTLSVQEYDGTAITTKDFLNNGETVADVENPGSHVLAGSVGYCLANGTCPRGASTTDFSVSYNEQTHFFNVVLLTEPLGAVRKEAEDFLQTRLDITTTAMCKLNYFVGTPYWVNSVYDDRNLGFSFCPGATKLP